MPATVTDMSVGMDMTKTCASILNCATTCFTGTSTDPVGCALMCAAGAPAAAQTNFGALVTCLEMNCALDAGVASLKTCAATALGTSCKSQAATCGGS